MILRPEHPPVAAPPPHSQLRQREFPDAPRDGVADTCFSGEGLFGGVDHEHEFVFLAGVLCAEFALEGVVGVVQEVQQGEDLPGHGVAEVEVGGGGEHAEGADGGDEGHGWGAGGGV